MIGSLRGKLIYKKPDYILVEVRGVGYQVNVSFNTLSILPEEDEDIFIHIYTHVREDTLQLYGFASGDEKKIFITLLGITGIGPKMALNILSGITHNELLHAIESEDVAYLCRIPGLGKKTAHRLILELKGKLPSLKEPVDRVFEDTLSALVNLGYKKSIAQESLKKSYKQGFDDIEGLLKESLKYLTGDMSEKNR
jgi:Holliday junction DNA helicase RuvA